MRRFLVATVLATLTVAMLPGPALAAPRASDGSISSLAQRLATFGLDLARPGVAVARSRPISVLPAAPRADIEMSHVWQSLNNCGPASVAMILSSMGLRVSQEEARVPLRGTNVLRGMGVAPIGPYVSSHFGLQALGRNNGTNALLKTLITNGFAPMVTQWLDDPSRIAHWRVVRGYDDDRNMFFASDPMRGAAVPLDYQWFADNWLPFQYRYAVIYRAEDEELLKAIVGDDWFDAPARFNFLVRARDEASTIGSYEAWLSYGEAAYQTGRFGEAVMAFETGMAKGSPNGIYNVRGSYPAALRMIGREDDARAASRRLGSITPVPLTTPNADELRQIQSLIGEQPVRHFRDEFGSAGAWLTSRRAVADLLRAE